MTTPDQQRVRAAVMDVIDEREWELYSAIYDEYEISSEHANQQRLDFCDRVQQRIDELERTNLP